ncbi:MAG: hypothetical protein JNK02_04040 [Planctomycetes bacterium]|nr:hypothetical protein [Planctomycetota bacterium]
MQILSHRGYWRSAEEKNSTTAFARSFELGFGTELDLRDLARRLVVSHDPPAEPGLPADDVLAIHAAHDRSLPLALNVKSDGLQDLVVAALRRHAPADAFVFDMSIPDTLHWLRRGVPVFTRHSEVEPEPALYDQAAGVWLDAFHGDWWDADVVRRHVEAGKRVCVVSPELHRRDHRAAWERLRVAEFRASDRVLLCTDLPEDARGFFAHED